MERELMGELILAAEDFDFISFRSMHYFSEYEDRIIRKLVAHGPVLLRGGRGSGKSALLREAAWRLNGELSGTAFGVYLSLRHLPLLRSTGTAYEQTFCQLLIARVNEVLRTTGSTEIFECGAEVSALHSGLADLAKRLNRRIVLMFDDAAHIGREASLSEFFDIFRTISGDWVSCKAAIYPGVTHFGIRFDFYNDATVVDLARNEDSETFGPFFESVLELRYRNQITNKSFSEDLTLQRAASLVGRAVNGNVRAFVYVWGRLASFLEDNPNLTIGLPVLGETLISAGRDYFWPLFEELRPKLGMYAPLINPASDLATELYSAVAKSYGSRSALVHRDYVERLSKLFEILEYTGFVTRREASRGMKSGGRGTRFVMNLCNLLEQVPRSRLTWDLFHKWSGAEAEAVEIHTTSDTLSSVQMPPLNPGVEPTILEMPISTLIKSQIYPYGLTEHRIRILESAGISTIGELAAKDDAWLDALNDIGGYWVDRIKNVVAQAVWM